jgi:hypothetical protein
MESLSDLELFDLMIDSYSGYLTTSFVADLLEFLDCKAEFLMRMLEVD